MAEASDSHNTVRVPNDDRINNMEKETLSTELTRKRTVSDFDADLDLDYSRGHLHRSCKLVIRETGQCLFSFQREMNLRPKPKIKRRLPKLPPEIWIKIFSYITHERQYPFMIIAPFVCKEWYNLCLDPSLWTYVRVPYGGYYWMQRSDNFLVWLARNRLASCKEIDLTGWDITASAVQELAKNCPRLQTINLSDCTKLSKDVATYLTRHCPDIHSVDFSHTCNDLVSVIPMTVLIEHCGPQLIKIDISSNLVHGFQRVFDAICENCPNLESLSVSNCRVDVIILDIERLQRSLLHLRTLNMGFLLAFSVNVTEKPSYLSPGFRSLEDLSIAVGTPCDNRHPLPINDNIIERMVLASRQLKSLDIRGAQHFSVQTLLKLSCPDLEGLHLGVSIIDDPTGLVDVIKMYHHSIRELVLSYSCFTIQDINTAINLLIAKENKILRELELENLDVEMPMVKTICQNCPNLRTLNLQKCLLLPKKLRRLFSQQKIHHLRHLVKHFCKQMNIT